MCSTPSHTSSSRSSPERRRRSFSASKPGVVESSTKVAMRRWYRHFLSVPSGAGKLASTFKGQRLHHGGRTQLVHRGLTALGRAGPVHPGGVPLGRFRAKRGAYGAESAWQMPCGVRDGSESAPCPGPYPGVRSPGWTGPQVSAPLREAQGFIGPLDKRPDTRIWFSLLAGSRRRTGRSETWGHLASKGHKLHLSWALV